ncbi:MAG: methyltransferase [Buchananella hordeovulneris]|nr:methyltransferase [Buchananella hordeovulneris]
MSHYFDATPTSELREQKIVTIQGRDFAVTTAGGVFSTARLDPGTAVLLSHVPPPPRSGVLADVGCGWGPITLALAAASPQASVVAADVNSVARSLTTDNCAAAGLTNVEVLGQDAPAVLAERGVKLAGLWSNPPIRIGKPALHELLLAWLPLLDTAAKAHLVVGKNLGADSLQRWLIEQGFPTERIASAKGFRILEVSARA